MDATGTPRRAADAVVNRTPGGTDEHDTVVVGGGQAGLTIGAELVRQGRDVVILDAYERIGQAWRRRWDSLRLNTPAKYDGLPGMAMGEDRFAFPTKDEFADYLERYAAAGALPVRTGARVVALDPVDGRYVLETADGRRFRAANVVIATGAHQVPRRPSFADRLAPEIVSLHSDEYRNPGQLAPGRVLVVGFGNSASEIAFDVSRSHETWISGRPTAELPFRHGRAAARFGFPVVRFIGLYVATASTPLGRRMLARMQGRAELLIRVRRRELAAAGVHMVPRTTGIEGGRPVVDGTVLDVANVIWCTGFDEDFGWVHLPAFEGGRRPRHDHGAVDGAPGVYLLGQHLLQSEGSGTLVGVGRDARWIARRIAAAPAAVTSADAVATALRTPA
ncbi:NAD(P)/FAD-dependent oxidoreductase [Agromyces tropicus]|uniref:NAD(P)/FAD-dependent oxidoreductase n=1 Tax=Agromyces tropicus TaxID=555371 RepID=A0ABP5G0L2_9MICO